ncbi:MAG: hypothetical protein ACI4RS_06830 [Monoglobaceae bacterium]
MPTQVGGMEIIMKNKNKNKQQINPEIQREEEERYKSLNFYDEDDGLGMTLFPYCFMGGTASATDSTGLMQTIPLSLAELEAYDSLYSYRQDHPTADNNDIKNA